MGEGDHIAMTRPQRQVPVHYLRPNHTSWTPPSVFTFDTETRSQMDGDSEIMTLRVWSARFSDRRPPKRVNALEDADHGQTSAGIAILIDKWCKSRRTVWG